MQSHIDTTTQLDLVRADAAARQRRAATYRFVHAERPSRTGRRSLASTAIGATLALGVVTGAAAQVIASQPIEQGYEAGLPDGWFDPAEPTFSTADDTVRPASIPVRQGYLPGQPDGWFDPAEPTVQVAGVVLDRTGTVPRNVR